MNKDQDIQSEQNTESQNQFAHLGAPRPYDANEVIGNIRGSMNANDPVINTIKELNKPTSRPSYNFKLVKTDTLGASPLKYMVWGGLIVIIVISVMASLTQGVLLVKDKMFPKPVAATNIEVPILPKTEPVVKSTEPMGSDDGKLSNEQILNFTPMYKVADPDKIQSLGITSKAYYVADLQTGERIIAKNSTDVYPIASVSKLMTALVAYEKLDLQKVVVVSRDSYNAYGAEGELVPGEKIKLGDLLYPLLMESSNDGAEVIAESYGRVEFMSEMNKKAASLGMRDTYYEDPSGLNPKNTSSPEDLFKLMKYVKEKAPILYDMTRVREFAILKHKWFNKNRLLNIDLFTGGKNGYIDESRWTTASTFDIVMAKGGKRSVGIVLLMSENREGDATKIINFLQKNVYYTDTGNF